MCRILLVDDDPILLSTLSTFLIRCGYDTLTQATNGLEALASLSSFSVDLIITDCQMPVMDGLSFVRALRSQGHCMPIIMLSGQGDPRITQLALRIGVTQYFAKPFPPLQLLDAVRQLADIPSNLTPQAA